ncbi:MAG TPA: GNAT family protein [Pseudonocardiaceae bacterium]
MTYRDVLLRPVVDADLAHLAAIEPADFEHDPALETFPALTPAADRARQLHQTHWRARGTWSPSSWTLDLAVVVTGRVAGVQFLEGEDFPRLRTVDSASWLEHPARGRGIGVAMRTAVLGLAFDHLGAAAAVTSARWDNHASLGVSRRLGYRPNGVSLNASPSGVVELTHLRLTRDDWLTSGLAGTVAVTGLEPCLPWFGLAP